MLRNRLSPLMIYFTLTAVSALLFQVVVTIYVVYYAQVGLDAFQIVLMGTIFETTIFLTEIPTGVVADVYSRRLSVILGIALTGIGYLIAGIEQQPSAILVQELITGVGATFLSGATEAWITDEIGEARAGGAFVRANQIKIAASIIGIVFSVVIASLALNLTFVIAGVGFASLMIFLILFMPEIGFRRSERATWLSLFNTARDGLKLIRLRPILLLILGITFIFAFHTEGFDHLWQKHILDDFTLPTLGSLDPIVWFGIISLGANVCSLILNEIMRRRVDLGDHAATGRVLMIVYGLQAVGIVLFSVTGHFGLAVIAYGLTLGLRWSSDPLSKAWLNQHLEPRTRATVFSFSGQVAALGEIIGGPPIGVVAQVVSLPAALAICGVVIALTLPLFGMALRREPAAVQG